MDNNERLLRIKEQCDKRGWIAFIAGDENGENHQLQVKVPVDVAEALLAATDPQAPVVAVRQTYTKQQHKGPDGNWQKVYKCSNNCGLNNHDCVFSNYEPVDDTYYPGPNCPGEGPHRLVRVEGGRE